MSKVIQTPVNRSTSSTNMLRAMVGIGVLCALLIAVTYENTLPRIEQLKSEALERAIFRVLPGTSSSSAFQYDAPTGFRELKSNTKSKDTRVVYAGYDDTGNLTGIAIEASGQGYADVIRILYGYDPVKQQIVGFHVLESKETPGLGDKIEKDATFLENFSSLDVSLTDDGSALKNLPVTVKRGTKQHAWEIDGITGATISSRAIGAIISSSAADMVPMIFLKQRDFTLKAENE